MQTRNILHAPSFVNEDLVNLERMFSARGFELVLVGGCVRDSLCGQTPKDVDLATSATPEEQIDLYKANDLRYIETGLQHGTITVVMNGEPYEITTYRIDEETDGRHATVAYTRDLTEDLARRDLTINAIAMRFDGTLVDPFGGIEDLKNGSVRFVGNTRERIEEDYLRILRFFRFHGRFGTSLLDQEALVAVSEMAGGLSKISVERIWMEVSKIISGKNADGVMSAMSDLGVFEAINMPSGDMRAFLEASQRGVTNPASIMGWYLKRSLPEYGTVGLALRWKWSDEEKQRASFVANNTKAARKGGMAFFKRLLVDGMPFDWVADLMRFTNVDPSPLADWVVPKLPVNGQDLMGVGVKPGPFMGELLGVLKVKWVASDYTVDKNSLMTYLNEVLGRSE